MIEGTTKSIKFCFDIISNFYIISKFLYISKQISEVIGDISRVKDPSVMIPCLADRTT